MKCPKCKNGDLKLYKETEKSYQFKITKDNKVHKRPFSTLEFDTEKDYLECENVECQQWFNYELDSDRRVIEDSVFER